MKKITLLACSLVASIAMFAGVNEKLVKTGSEKVFVPSIQMVETKSSILPEGVVSANQLQNSLAEVVTDTIVLPYVVPGTYNCGTPSSGLAYVNEASIITPYCEEVTFYNYAGLTSTWYINDELVATDTALTVKIAGLGQQQPLPLMKTATLPTSDTTQLAFVDYQFGAYYTSKYAQHGFTNYLLTAPAYLKPLTKCAMYTELKVDNRGDDTYGSDWTFVGGGSVGTYSYGTNMVHPSTGIRFDTILIPYTNPGTMYIDHISAGVYTAGEGGVAGMFPAETDHVRASIYPLTEQGIDFANPIATAVATADDYVGLKNASSWYGILNFNFTDIDPITGAETDVPTVVSGDFVIAFDQFNDGTANFGFIADYFTEITGDTYLIGSGILTQLWKSPSNLLVNLYALMPVFEAPEVLEFKAGEPAKEFTVVSNVWDEDLSIDADDWIDVEVVTDYEEFVEEGETYQEHLYTNKVKVTVTNTAEAREGEITIDALGLPVSIVVKQEAGSGVENVHIMNDNKFYNVLGQEVSEDYKGVVIRNGEKFVR